MEKERLKRYVGKERRRVKNREVKEESRGGEGRKGGLTDLNVVHRDLS